MGRAMWIIMGVIIIGLSAGFAAAQTPAPFPEFTFKRVTPPGADAGPRITVQIDPNAQTAPLALPQAQPQSAAPAGSPAVTAFWDAVGLTIEAGSPARLEAARAVTRNQGISAPSLQVMQEIAAKHGRTLLSQSIETGVSPALALAVIAIESSGRESAISSAGAQGLMQLIPATAERFNVADAFDPAQNITGGMAYLEFLLNRFQGDALLALAGYNAGENAVTRAGGVPDFSETRAYVPKVVAAWEVARSLCLTPPELATDGCVFGVIAAN